MACDDEIVPLQSRIESVTDDSDLEEVYNTERFLLYIACTRARVAQRVRQGGHHIPEETIRRRFAAGRRNFESLYAPLVDAWALYDNAGPQPVLLDWSEKP
jgi:hypothetical protein